MYIAPYLYQPSPIEPHVPTESYDGGGGGGVGEDVAEGETPYSSEEQQPTTTDSITAVRTYLSARSFSRYFLWVEPARAPMK